LPWNDNELARVLQIETTINELLTAVANLMTKKQYRQLMAIRQAEIESLQTDVIELQSRLSIVENRVNLID
jgi:hypothetical protein